MDNSHVMDDSYQLMSQFMNNIHDKQIGMGNIYVAKVVDKNGNVKDVKFGKNMMTDYGMQQYFIENKSYPTYLYIGHGSTAIGFNHTTHELVDPYDCEATVVNGTPAYGYPMYYDKISGLVTVVCRAMQVKFPLTIDGIPDAISITEYGIGYKDNSYTSRQVGMSQLFTHSWVYDTAGGYGTLIKNPEEELYIDVYYCMSYDEQMILDNWDNGRYTIITTMQRFFNRMAGTLWRYRRDNTGIACDSTVTKSAFQNNLITIYRNLTSFVMKNEWPSSDDDKKRSGYFDGFCNWISGFFIVERELLDVPESFSAIITPDGFTDKCLSNRFGKFNQDSIPLTQADIAACKLYNPDTHDWDNTETFLNDSNKWYTETLMQTLFGTPVYYTNNNTIINLYVHLNIQTNDPIVGFDINQTTVYAAEKYWDKTTWHLITNLQIIPTNDTNEYEHTMNCQTARYYLTADNSNALNPHRANEGFVVVPTDGRSAYLPFTRGDIVWRENASNYEAGWYQYGQQIYSVKDSKTYSYTELSAGDSRTMSYGKWLVSFNNENNGVRYLDTSDFTTKPSMNLLSLTWTRNTNSFTESYTTETGTGYFTMQSTKDNVSQVLDFTGNNPTATQYTTTKICSIWGTNRIAYIHTSDTTHIQVYELGSTNAVVATLDLPSGYNVSLMFGHTNYIWIVSTSDTVDTYCYDIRTGDSFAMSPLAAIRSDNRYVMITNVDRYLVIHKMNDYTYANHYWIDIADPATRHNLAGVRGSQTADGSNGGRRTYRLAKVHNSSYILICNMWWNNNNNTGTFSFANDFGNFVDGHRDYMVYTADSNQPPWILYGGYIVTWLSEKYALENFMPHKITGATRTITSINNFTNVRNKQFRVTITNLNRFNGLPPGDKQ